MKKIAISDIHGCARTFVALLEKVDFQKEDSLYLLGDYIDRGPDSKGVLDTILSMQKEGFNVFCLKGNHEDLMLKGLMGDRDALLTWLMNGGEEALSSFDPEETGNVPSRYLAFLDSLPCYFEVDHYILVHAGLNFIGGNPFENQHSLMWIRNWYQDIDRAWLGDRIIVHGHTPRSMDQIKQMHTDLDKNAYLNIDAGCVFNHQGRHHLCAFDLTSRQLFFQKNID
ncbi:MAG: serine/threonine protein phosphatase [Saprospiraceae bacterium]|nr:serine/threonine protein phosphatase [Saprospiraceae bacterium]